MKQKIILIVTLALLINNPLFASDTLHETVAVSGIGIGTVLAMIICWERTESIVITALAGIFGWFYVVYYVVFIRPSETD